MKASHQWLCELAGVEATPEEVASRLTALGLEVEEITRFGVGLDQVVIAEVRAAERVEGKDKLRLVTVFDGEGDRQVICGAPNVPEPGGRVVLAKPGAVLPSGMAIAERSVGGVRSAGMLCSEAELGIGEGDHGILVLQAGEAGVPGAPVAEALNLEDHVFEIGITPNRPDCLGHIGLARELAIAFGRRFREPAPGVPSRLISNPGASEPPFALPLVPGDQSPTDTLTLVARRQEAPPRVAVWIDNKERCPRYTGTLVEGVRIQRSPFWLRYRLHVLGVRAIDNVVDITNLVLFETGHPIHAFDVAHLRGPEINVRLATDGEQMTTLDGETRTFTSDDLLICDAEGPVAVAGVMGGANSEIRPDTRDVFIEVAYFEPRGIRRTSRRLGMHTDSSHRFERGVDPNRAPWVMRRAVSLLSMLAQGAAPAYGTDLYPTRIWEQQIPFEPALASRLFGVEIPAADARRALEGVGCAISPGVQSGWRVTCPSWRPDLTRVEDLFEEVGRIFGYDKVPTLVPRIRPSGRGLHGKLGLIRRLRDAAVDQGLLEAINYAFVSPGDLRAARVDEDAVRLANPLSEERSVLRTSLLPGLLGDAGLAARHQVRGVALFEIARTYHPGEGGAPIERSRAAFLLGGARVEQFGEAGRYDFYDAKGVLESLLDGALGLPVETISDPTLAERAPFLHPRRAACVQIAGQAVGVVGEVHPDVGDACDLPFRAVFCELDVDAIVEISERRGPARAVEPPRFPSMARDLALVVADDVEVGRVVNALREAGGELLVSVELFDVYRGAGIREGDKSLAFRLVYRDPAATLTDKRVEKAHRAATRGAQEALGATVRGADAS